MHVYFHKIGRYVSIYSITAPIRNECGLSNANFPFGEGCANVVVCQGRHHQASQYDPKISLLNHNYFSIEHKKKSIIEFKIDTLL